MSNAIKTIRNTIRIHFVPKHKELPLSENAQTFVAYPVETFVINNQNDIDNFLNKSRMLLTKFSEWGLDSELEIISECGDKRRVVEFLTPDQVIHQILSNLDFSKKQNKLYDIIWLGIIAVVLYFVFK